MTDSDRKQDTKDTDIVNNIESVTISKELPTTISVKLESYDLLVRVARGSKTVTAFSLVFELSSVIARFAKSVFVSFAVTIFLAGLFFLVNPSLRFYLVEPYNVLIQGSPSDHQTNTRPKVRPENF